MKQRMERVALVAAVVLMALHLTGSVRAQSIFEVVAPNLHPAPYQDNLLAVSASSPSEIWAVGQTTIHFDGTA